MNAPPATTAKRLTPAGQPQQPLTDLSRHSKRPTLATQHADPQIPEARRHERAVIGAIFVGGYEAHAEAASIVGPADFLDLACAECMSAFAALHDEQAPLGPLAVTDALQRSGRLESVGGVAGVAELVQPLPDIVNVRWYATRVLDASVRRQVAVLARRVERDACDFARPVAEIMAQAIEELTHLQARLISVGGER